MEEGGSLPLTKPHGRAGSVHSTRFHSFNSSLYENIHCGGDLREADPDADGLLSRCLPFIGTLRSFRKRHDRFLAYQRSLPFKTVVPEPPHTLREYLACALRYVAAKVFWVLFFLLCGPFLLLAHLVLTVLDRRQRRLWETYQRDWPHHSVPHVRPVRYKADAEFPLEEWHLRSEDGRQRWYHGAPLLTPEEGNEYGIAQVYGLNSVAELYEQADSAGVSAAAHTGADESEDNANGVSVRSSEANSTASLSGFDVSGSRRPRHPRHAPALPGLPPLSKGGKEMLARKMEARERLEKYQLGEWPAPEPARRPRATAEEAMRDGVDFLLKLQDPFSGHWPNDYSGCMFLTPGVIFMKFITCNGDLNKMFPPNKAHVHVAPGGGGVAAKVGASREKAASLASFSQNEEVAHSFIGGCGKATEAAVAAIDAAADGGVKTVPCRCGEATRRELIRYLRNHQNSDGGWGQHTEGHSTMLGTVLSYLSLRLLGVPADDPQATAGRDWIRAEGGAVYTPMWGKVWLCILGLFSYDGVPPLPPELVLMPSWVPFAEGRAWCHSRVIAIPFSYFYGLRWSAPRHPLLESIKGEIFLEPFHAIPWRQYRHEVCRTDLCTPISGLFKVACKLLDVFERHHLGFLRRYALEQNWKHMAYDDENTHFICLGPVNKSLNMLVTWIREGEKSARFKLHDQRVDDYMYMGATGMKMNGYNGSQLWDTSFAVQAICACRQEMLHPQAMSLAHHYVDVAQVQEDPIEMDLFARHRTKGAWNFSTSPQGWQVSDCTAEGLRVLLLLHHLPFPKHRLFDAVDEILSLRNVHGDGGWASYESTRAPYYCELMNCAELFKDVMVEYSYAECSSSCIHSLSLFREYFPRYRKRDVEVAIREGIACVLSKQRPDGSFYGSWAVCFTYAAWIVADALRVSGTLSDMANHPHCVRLINFLLEHQNSDGGWGEDINACVRQVWVDNPDGSQVVNTAWSVMAIMNASGESKRTSLPRRQRIVASVERGMKLLMSRQLSNGDWAQERISGVFNGNNPIHYPGYKNTMTVWALGRYNSWKTTYVV